MINKFLKLSILVLFVFCAFESAKAQLTKTTVSLTGNVTNAVTKEPVTVILKVKNDKGKTVNAAKSNAAQDGQYFIAGLKPGQTYFITIAQNDFFKENFEIKIPNTHQYKEISRDFLVKPLEKGIHIPLPIPPFELNKAKLRFGANELLFGFKNSMVNNPNIRFEILCYPDNNNDKSLNKKMTNERCKALMNYFASAGVDVTRMTIKGSQKTDPLNPPPTRKRAKGKRYIGTSYIVVTSF